MTEILRSPRLGRRAGPRTLALLVLLVPLLGACAAGSTPAPTPSPSPTPVAVTSADEAAALVARSSPLLASIPKQDPDLIGQAHFWEATPLNEVNPGAAGWRVAFRVGWGDCPSGCIDEHRWTFDVARDGTVTFVGETGPTIPPDVLAGLQGGTTGQTGVAGRALAGPTCPVERPGDPACAPRAVAGAEVVARAGDGSEVARTRADEAGFYRIELDPGSYVLEALPVEGLMGTPAQTPVTVAAGAETTVDLLYDTGIR